MAALFLLVSALLCSCPAPHGGTGDPKTASPEVKPGAPGVNKTEARVVATRLREGAIESYIEVSSDVETLNKVDLYPHLSGIQITEVLVDEGDFVEKGALMAQLDASEIELELNQAQVNYEEAKQKLEKSQVAMEEAAEREDSTRVQEEKAKRDYDKSLRMIEDELISDDELETDRLAWEQAASELDLARLQNQHAKLDLGLSQSGVERNRIAVENAKLDLSRTRITAPFNGYVTYRNATPGMTISTSSYLFTLVDYDVLVANLYIPQEDLLKIKLGMPVKFRCDALPGIHFDGTISIINPAVDPASGTVKLRAKIDSWEERQLRPGMFVSARIITAAKERALLVPRKAVFYDEEKPTFFWIRDDQTVEKVHFTSEASTDRDLEITSMQPPVEGICPDALIVIVGQDNLKNGDTVKIVKEVP